MARLPASCVAPVPDREETYPLGVLTRAMDLRGPTDARAAAAERAGNSEPAPSGRPISDHAPRPDRPPGYHDSKEQVLARLRRIEGQVRGLARLVEQDTYCIDVLTQVAAATKALQAVAVSLLEEHMRHCVADAAKEGGTRAEALVEEATRAIERLMRT